MDYLHSILDAIAAPVLAIDYDIRLVTANSAAKIALPEIENDDGFEELLGISAGLETLFQDAARGDKSKKAKINVGDRTDYLVTAIPTIVGAGQSVVLATFEDRTVQAGYKAMRQGFVANVSHEMRSPLTAISGIVETLSGPAIENVEIRTKFLEMMGKEVTRMTNLVSDLLSLSQVEAKERMTLKKALRVDSSIQQALESVVTLAQNHEKTVVPQLESDLPKIIGRQDDLTRLFINLLENAILYSQKNGQVTFTAGIAQTPNPIDKPAILISVRDDGEGIAPDDIPKLTERFFRVDKSRSRHLGGTGLGLAIVKHILVRHQGKLVIESELGEGSCFKVYLPIK